MQQEACKRVDSRQLARIYELISLKANRMPMEDWETTLLFNFGITTFKALSYNDAISFIENLEDQARGIMPYQDATDKPISKNQTIRIHTLVKVMKWTDERYRRDDTTG